MSPEVTIALSSVAGVISAVVMAWVNKQFTKKYTQAQVENTRVHTTDMIADQYHKLTESLVGERAHMLAKLEEDRKDYIQRMERNEQLISRLQSREKENQREILILKSDNEECKYLHQVAELEMMQLKKQNDFHAWKRESVYVVDDDPDVIEDFGHKFNKLSVLDYFGFISVNKFLAEAKINKPPIIVIDYRLNETTAVEVIEELGYNPEIFIMSGEVRYSEKFKEKNVRFFVKDENFILKIAKAIIEHLLNKEPGDHRYNGVPK